MSDPAFFGYGSLVNLATHNYGDPRPATLRGWRRVWTGTNLREAAFLSVEPARDSVISGVVARVPGANWAALDLREAAYQRHDITPVVRHNGHKAPTAVYQVDPAHKAATRQHPILLSYLDVVVQGYLQLFGHKGVAHFFATTGGWDCPLLDDRHAPRYPRNRELTKAERTLVDDHLAAVVQQAE